MHAYLHKDAQSLWHVEPLPKLKVVITDHGWYSWTPKHRDSESLIGKCVSKFPFDGLRTRVQSARDNMVENRAIMSRYLCLHLLAVLIVHTPIHTTSYSRLPGGAGPASLQVGAPFMMITYW